MYKRPFVVNILTTSSRKMLQRLLEMKKKMGERMDTA